MDDKRRLELIEYHINSTKDLFNSLEGEEIKQELFNYQVGSMFKLQVSFMSSLNQMLAEVRRLKGGL